MVNEVAAAAKETMLGEVKTSRARAIRPSLLSNPNLRLVLLNLLLLPWLLLGFCLYPIIPGRLSNQFRTGADRYTPILPR